MSLTVVVASRNRCEDLLLTLPRHEAPVILVDNGSTDGTIEAVRAAHPDVTVLPLPRNEGAGGRTKGVAAAGEPGRRGLARAARDVPGALRRRRPVPPQVWAEVRRLVS